MKMINILVRNNNYKIKSNHHKMKLIKIYYFYLIINKVKLSKIFMIYKGILFVIYKNNKNFWIIIIFMHLNVHNNLNLHINIKMVYITNKPINVINVIRFFNLIMMILFNFLKILFKILITNHNFMTILNLI